jgi:predicted ABC-type transport system involved in lysophospholipase L1 biosynthesis ATPase subunit
METLAQELGIAFVVVTHDLDLASRADRTLQLRDGRFVPEGAVARADSIACPTR